MKNYKVKQDYTDGYTGRMISAGDIVTLTDERAEQLQKAGVINLTPQRGQPTEEEVAAATPAVTLPADTAVATTTDAAASATTATTGAAGLAGTMAADTAPATKRTRR